MRNSQRFTTILTCILAGTLIAGCTPDVPALDVDQELVEAETPALTDVQMAEVTQVVGEALGAADAEKDTEALEQRVTGPALKIRQAEYRIATAQKSDDSLSELPATMQSVFMTNSQGWPRTIFAVSERPQNLEAERFVVYTQESAQDNYELWGWFPLFPGITVPTFPASGVGTQELSELDETLQLAPTDAINQYVSLLKKPSGDAKDTFNIENDTFVKEISDLRKYMKDAAKQVEGEYKESIKPSDEWHALRTIDGGAVIVTSIELAGTLKGESGALVTPSAIEKAFLKKDAKVKNALTVKRTAIIGVYVPAKEQTTQPYVLGRLLKTTGASIPD
ncbi:hypothetical protein [Jonesia denitrificans]|uniref:hypothetical protein n=1 Tax=Jonesia denitrificans TaxID=43674 RepID=UPI00019BCA40|nr:hypothetical protein [Jonesia denitrificans]ASE09374.1 hypothetical protein CEP80_09635 [Jonesia denitrificans]QXB43917.1 hypothetical protein I6L70_03285 [Jonesia denitrificans]SQH21667.1 Uncharacterised protein [Jonesia denitrificans]